MIRRPPRSTQSRSSAASDVYKRQVVLAIRAGQGQDAFQQGRIGAIGRAATAVAVDDGCHAVLAKAGSPPADLTSAHSQQLCGRLNIERPCLQAGQNLNFALLLQVQADCPHTSSMRTFSLSSNTISDWGIDKRVALLYSV